MVSDEDHPHNSGNSFSRRNFLGKAAAASSAAIIGSWASPIIERAYAADPGGSGSLNDIEHFVFLMQENRSFDHYFGTYPHAANTDGTRPHCDDPTGAPSYTGSLGEDQVTWLENDLARVPEDKLVVIATHRISTSFRKDHRR